jgi:hypothetical protein
MKVKQRIPSRFFNERDAIMHAYKNAVPARLSYYVRYG